MLNRLFISPNNAVVCPRQYQTVLSSVATPKQYLSAKSLAPSSLQMYHVCIKLLSSFKTIFVYINQKFSSCMWVISFSRDSLPFAQLFVFQIHEPRKCMSVDKFVALLLWRRVTFTCLFETLQVASWAASLQLLK